jgi:hypothetical protein
MARHPVTVELDGNLVDATREGAQRVGVPEGELYERALREVLARDFGALMDGIAANQAARGIAISEDEALALATEELWALRAEGRSAS